MKNRLLFWLSSCTLLLLLAAVVLPQSAYAADPASDGQNHILVKLTGANGRTGYKVTAASSVQSYPLNFDSKKGGFYSPPLPHPGNCFPNDKTTAANTYKINVTYRNGLAGSDTITFCNK